MNDDLFGILKWSYRDLWEGTATFPHFRTFGHALDEPDEPLPAAAVPRPNSPTKRQLDAFAQLQSFAGTLAGDEANLLQGALGVAHQKLLSPQPIPPPPSEPDFDPEMQRLREGTITVWIDATGPRSKPTKPQRVAWNHLLDRGDALWNEILERAAALYLRQRPVRARIWKATYGDFRFKRHLPDVTSSERMRRLIRPFEIRIKPAPRGTKVADIGIHFICTWHVDGFGVLIRGGQVIDVDDVGLVHPIKERPSERIEHPVFGPLRRIPDDDPWEVINQYSIPTQRGQSGFEAVQRGGPRPWEGRTRCDPFLEYAVVADDHAEFTHDPANADRPRSAMDWTFASGEFDLLVYAARDQFPGVEQANAFAAFRADQARYTADIVSGVFDQYQETFEVRRRNWPDKYADDVIPRLTSPDGLRDLMQLRHMHVHPADAHGRVTIAFQFACTWDYDGFTALWRDGKVVEWGTWKHAEPDTIT